jgi:hypothetical protein
LTSRKTVDVVKYAKTATQPIATIHHATFAAESEIPTPVNSATYAARQSGHFGIAARTTPGTIQLTARPTKRGHDRPATATFAFFWQQQSMFMRETPGELERHKF